MQLRQTLESVKSIVSRVSYSDWKFIVGKMGSGFYIQTKWVDLDHDTNELSVIKGAKHYVSSYATDDEIVKRCWVAVRDAVMHEVMEQFKLDGVAPFNPHNDVFEMLDLPKVHRVELNPELVNNK